MKASKLSLLIGAIIAAIPLFAGWIMFQLPSENPLTRSFYLLFGIGVPGMLFESFIRLAHEPHGGGTPIEMVMIVFPFNVVFYAIVIYIPVRVAVILIQRLRKHTAFRS
jgi:hypothetical protein